MKDPNDAKSVHMWVCENSNLVFYYQDPGGMMDGAITADNMPFVIGIQTSFQFRMMLQYGHQSAIAIDATFATNDKKIGLTFCFISCAPNFKIRFPTILNICVVSLHFPLFTMMVFDKWQNGVPVAFIITARQKQSNLTSWMQKVKEKMLAAKADWKPNEFVLHNADNEINSLR